MTHQRILATVGRDDFVGRDAELQQITRRASRIVERRGLVLLAAPDVGASELLRQAYDLLFSRRGESIPLYFAFKRGEAVTDSARRLFQSCLQQYIAYRRVDPALCDASLTLHDLSELVLPGDYELISELIESFDRERAGGDEQDLIRFSLNTPRRFIAAGRNIFPLVDCVQLACLSKEETILGREIAGALARSHVPFTLAGLRRRLIDLMQAADGGRGVGETLHLEKLDDTDAQRLVELVARRDEVETNQPTRDLIVQQLNASPLFINNLLQAARETKTPVTSFLNCQRLYVDELMGGRLQRHFSGILNEMAPHPQTRKTLLRILYESAAHESPRPSFLAWKKRLGVESSEFERIVDLLHVHELANSSGAFIEINGESNVWMDYLRIRYRLEVAGEERALVVATTLLETLKRAPQTMARKYRREAALGIGDLISRFNCQRVPASLFHYDRFAATHKGADPDAVDAALDNESDLVRLPQIVHVAGCSSFGKLVGCDIETCAIGHGFEAAEYTDENEVVWLAAQIESKLEASRELAEEWCNRLLHLAREYHFSRVRLWLIAPEGFSPEACALLNEHEAYGSSHSQLELLTARIKSEAIEKEGARPDEYEMVIPMGQDTELIAAHTLEQIARRLNFRPEAINQIKTALVEACINAAEHSLSPDRKIYQRFRVEADKLVITVASRGVAPAGLASQNGEGLSAEQEKPDAKSRRGWGLKLIKTLMDEVEFERVDDGTQIRMIKYRR
ncbi:MAG: hypothetical protein DMF74_02615 [Acidobacteria bacterium]|nr:MAG: hypothetical protein DMF74_02615 [Acidobacteriota bacterium]